MPYYCCVPSCRNTNKLRKMHRFPLDDELCRRWVELIANANLFNKDLQTIKVTYRVCDEHFAEDCRVPGRHGADILATGIPTLNLPPSTNINEPDVVLIDEDDVSDVQMSANTIQEVPLSADKEPIQGPSLSSEVSMAVDEREDHTSPVQSRSTPIPMSRKDLRRRVNILKTVNVSSNRQLTPKARKMYHLAKSFRKSARRLDVECATVKQRLNEAQNLINSPEFMQSQVNKATYNFILAQLRNQRLSPKARRFSVDDKIMALSLWKQSPKGYKLLRKIFAVPSKRTLVNLLRKIPFESGVNQPIIDLLKKTLETMDPLDKYCTILFDEMSIDPSLTYNQSKDIIGGFQDNGQDERKPVFADKVMVFMARGVHKKWKQPLAYYFNEGGMKKDTLVKSIKEVIRAARSAGLNVVATACDQGSANVAAINILYQDTEAVYKRCGKENRNFGFEIDGEEVVPIYDPPHLLKGIRNALYKDNVKYTWRRGINTMASWQHIIRLYELEDQDDDYKLCSKLTDAHVHNLKKMKVKMAAQVFSARVAAAMRSLARHAQPDRLTPDALDTAEFLLFMDKAFDSVNGARVTPEHGKPLRAAVTDTSDHFEFWPEAIKVFESMRFVDPKRKEHVTPSIKNWIHTLKGFHYLCTKLLKNGFKFVCPRNFNQDPLENFFGCIRSHGVRNINPSCESFVASFKSLIINNFTTPHSPSSNCEADDAGGLELLKEFLKSSSIDEDDGVIPATYPEFNIPEIIDYMPLNKQGKMTYIAGYVSKKILKYVKNCEQCKIDLIGSPEELDDESRSYIENRMYSHNSLLYPTTNFNKLFQISVHIVSYVLPKICHKKNVKFILQQNILNNVIVENMFNCDQHDILKQFLNFFTKFHIHTWIKNINLILKGKDVKTRTYSDPMKVKAKNKFQSHQKTIHKIKEIKNLN